MKIDDIFDLDQTEHRELFDGVSYGWEVLPNIAEYIQKKRAQKKSETGLAASDFPGATIGPDVHIGQGTIIEPGVVILGPALIGANCHIRAGAYLRENAIVGDNCIIGNSTEMKNAILFNGAAVPHFNYVGDSIPGHGAHLGAGVILSNVKVPMGEISVTVDDRKVGTGLQKFGALIGDRVEIGSNAVLNPATIIGRDSIVYPLALVRGSVAPRSILKVRQHQEVAEKRSVDENV